MKLVLLALRRPVTILVAVLDALLAGLAVVRMPVDIFPQLGAPAIYVARRIRGDRIRCRWRAISPTTTSITSSTLRGLSMWNRRVFKARR